MKYTRKSRTRKGSSRYKKNRKRTRKVGGFNYKVKKIINRAEDHRDQWIPDYDYIASSTSPASLSLPATTITIANIMPPIAQGTTRQTRQGNQISVHRFDFVGTMISYLTNLQTTSDSECFIHLVQGIKGQIGANNATFTAYLTALTVSGSRPMVGFVFQSLRPVYNPLQWGFRIKKSWKFTGPVLDGSGQLLYAVTHPTKTLHGRMISSTLGKKWNYREDADIYPNDDAWGLIFVNNASNPMLWQPNNHIRFS